MSFESTERTPRDEINTQRSLAAHLLKSAASAAVEGDMEAFGYAMGVHRETEERIRSLSRSETARLMRDMMSELSQREPGGMFRGASMDDRADRHFRVPIAEALTAGEAGLSTLRARMESGEPIMDMTITPYHHPGHIIDVLDGMLARHPEDFDFPPQAV